MADADASPYCDALMNQNSLSDSESPRPANLNQTRGEKVRSAVRSFGRDFVREHHHVALVRTVLQPLGQDDRQVVNWCLSRLWKCDPILSGGSSA